MLGRLAVDVSLRSRHFDRAVEVARRAVPDDSKDFRNHLWFGQVLWASGRAPEAEKALRNAMSIAPNQPETRLLLVAFLAQTGRKEQAEATIDQAKHALPQPVAWLALAECYEIVGQVHLAEQYYRDALRTAPDVNDVMQAVAGFYLRTRQNAKAESLYRRLLDPAQSASPRAVANSRRVLATMLAGTGDYHKFREALELIDQNLSENRNSLADVRVKARLLARRGFESDLRTAIRLLEELDEQRTLFEAALRSTAFSRRTCPALR